jgi:hypothetical protein
VSETLISDTGDTSRSPGHLRYAVFRTDEEATEQFSATVGVTYALIPTSIGHPTICGSGECVVLNGNVVVSAFGVSNGIDLPGWGTHRPDSFDTLTLARVGVTHLDAVFDGLLR